MKNPFKVAPRCVQWASVILFALPVLDMVVALSAIPALTLLSQWRERLLPTSIIWCFALGLLYGINVVRIGYIAMVLLGLFNQVVIIGSFGFPLTGAVYDFTGVLVPVISLVLTFLPAANRYFTPKSYETNRAKTSKFRIVALVIGIPCALWGGVLVYRFVASSIRNAPQINQEREKINRAGQEAQVLNNLRLLATAASQYYFEHSATTAEYSELVGTNRFITRLPSVAGEKYPDKYDRDAVLVAVMPDGIRLSYDPQTGQTSRYR